MQTAVAAMEDGETHSHAVLRALRRLRRVAVLWALPGLLVLREGVPDQGVEARHSAHDDMTMTMTTKCFANCQSGCGACCRFCPPPLLPLPQKLIIIFMIFGTRI
jgi:hypothetical protein